MKSIIIDDEATARAIISQLCSTYKEIEVLEEFSNAIEAIKYLNKNEVDLVFLDIHMPDFTGFDFIQTLKKPPKIILTSSDVNFAIQAFEYCCIVDYLVKPITPERFQKTYQKVKTVTNLPLKPTAPEAPVANTNELYINIDKRLIKIDIPSIYMVEAKGDYIDLKTDNKNYTVHSTLKKIQSKLPANMFLKVHRSYIINVSRIIDIEDNSVLINKEVIPVSRQNRQKLMQRLNLL